MGFCMVYQPIVGTLGYCLSKDGKKVLLMHRNKNQGDDHLGKYNGLGGKMHEDEDIDSSMRREFLEESGLVVKSMRLKGTINWTGFGKNQENWLGFIFRIDAFEGQCYSSCKEGDLEWIDLEKIESLPMWEGDSHFLHMVFDDENSLFHGIMSYDGDKMVNCSFSR
jgi:8-oxo-dGTP diphosphatase